MMARPSNRVAPQFVSLADQRAHMLMEQALQRARRLAERRFIAAQEAFIRRQAQIERAMELDQLAANAAYRAVRDAESHRLYGATPAATDTESSDALRQ
jgi:ribosomal protein S13